jgi:hypothetical protein
VWLSRIRFTQAVSCREVETTVQAPLKVGGLQEQVEM